MARWEPMLEQVVRERYPRLVAHAMLLVPSRQEAEDLVQDAVVSTFSGRARFATVAEAEAYVRRAVVSRFLDAGRRRASEGRALAKVGARLGPDAEPAVVPGLEPGLETALAVLPPRVRACVVLRHMEDLSVRETAQLLRLSEGAVKRYVADGIAALNAALGVVASVDRELVETKEQGRGA